MAPVTIDVGQKWIRNGIAYRVVGVEDGMVVMHDTTYKEEPYRIATETIERFVEEAMAGRAVLHPFCEQCGFPVDPEEGEPGPVHYECWFQQASVRERVEAESKRYGGGPMASEALTTDDPVEFLLDVIGDPARSFHDRCEADNLLSLAVDTATLVDAWFRCPTCLEGEAFEMDPATGAVHCHCGERLKPAD